MTRRKYNPKKYKRSNPGDPLTEEWTVRSAIMYGVKRDILIKKDKDGKKQRRMIDDNRMSPTISWGDAKRFNEQRSPRARKLDRSLQHKKQKSVPDRAWKNRPSRSDIKGIDSKKKAPKKSSDKNKPKKKKNK